MKKLQDLKSAHFGIGMLVLIFQLVFQISNTIYLFGLMLILLSVYETKMIKRLILQKDDIQKIRKSLNQYKYLNLALLIPIFILINSLISEIKNDGNLVGLLLNDPILFFNIFVIGGIILHFSVEIEIRKIEKEIINF